MKNTARNLTDITTDTDYSHVTTRILDTACLGLTEDEFTDLAIACSDQAGVDPATQAEIRRLIEASRARRVRS